MHTLRDTHHTQYVGSNLKTQNMIKQISRLFQSVLILIGLQSCGEINTTKNFENGQKNLVVFSDHF